MGGSVGARVMWKRLPCGFSRALSFFFEDDDEAGGGARSFYPPGET